MQRMAALIALAVILTGCAQKMQLAPPRGMAKCGLAPDPAEAARLEKSFTDQDIAKLLDARIQAHLPTGIAVAKISDKYGCACLLNISAEEMAGWQKALARPGKVLGAMPVSDLALQSDSVTFHRLRATAARMNCELLLVYMPADSEVDNFNDAAILYWTIIGLWVIPGDTLERQTIVQAVLMDCRTGTILGTATGDHHAKRFASATLREPRWASMRKETTAAALQDLQKSCAALIDNLVAGSSAPAAALMPAN